MKIADSMLALQSTRTAESRDLSRESLQVWQRGAEPEIRQVEGTAVGILRQRATVLLQRPPADPVPSPNVEAIETQIPADKGLDKRHELEVSLLKLLVERFTGRRIQVVSPEALTSAGSEASESAQPPTRQQATPEREGWGLVYQRTQSHYEAERTRFEAQGVVRTADGREITVELQLSMSREFFSEESVSLRAGDALKDPLVVNFSGQATELTRQRYSFDIDVDGVADQIHFVTPESGFLALDRNRDGVINDGSELFGAVSGDGFAELGGYDSDANGWIDENDAVYEQLRIWSKDGEGRDQLIALGAAGIGAVYLGHVTTPFELKNEQNALQGAVRESGLYLREEGGVGSLQQVDLVV